MSREYQSLCEPISADSPCGKNLEDSQLLASFDGYRLFGQASALEPPPDWTEMKARAAEALATSKDLRLLVHLSAALIRTDGIPVFCETLSTAAQWLESFWETVFPLLDEDALLRRNALNCFADRVAVVDPLRRAALLTHPQFGAVSVRDVDLASGQLAATDGDARRPDETQITAVFSGSKIEKVTEALADIEAALTAI